MHNRYLISNARGRRRFADALVDYLIGLGVEYLFGMPAESVNSLIDAASRRSEIQVVSARHESAAALMAVGYARSSGRLGVCFGSAGPGATNLVAGAYEAFLARVPLLVISGQVPLASMGREAFQEIDSAALFQHCTSASVQINSASQFERFARSCVLSVHESTACHVAIPGDVLYAPIGRNRAASFVPRFPTPMLPSKEELRSVAAFLDSDDLAILLSNPDSSHVGLVELLSAQLDCPVYTVGPHGTGTIPARNVLVVGRSTPFIKKRLPAYANLLELTDRRFTSKCLPYIKQVVCDVEATLLAVLYPDERHDYVESSTAMTVFTDIDNVENQLSGNLRDAAIVSSAARIPGAALPLGIGAALSGITRSLVVTDESQLNQFVSDLSTMVRANADLVVVCLADDDEMVSRIAHLGAAMSMRTTSDVVGIAGPAIVAMKRSKPVGFSAAAFRPGEHSLAHCLDANLAAPVQISDFCAPLLPCLRNAQRSANGQAPSMSASALRKSGRNPVGTIVASPAALLLQLNGIYDAAMDHARILVATVESPDWPLDTRRMLEEVTVARFVADDPATAAATVRQACVAAAASGGGVVHLQVRGSVLETQWAACTASGPDLGPRPPGPDSAVLAEAISALRSAQRVVVIAGRGAAGCAELLHELSELLCCPVHLTMGGDSVLHSHSLRAQGRAGASGDLRASGAVARADALLLVGVSNRGSAFDLGASGRTIAVNIDPNTMLRLTGRDIGVVGDAVSTLESMVGALRADCPRRDKRSRPSWRRRRRLMRRGEGVPLRASSVVQAIDEELDRFDGTSTVCADVGVNTLWVYRYLTSMTRSVWSASFGTMGFAVPAAVSVARNSVDPGVVLAVAGDGGVSVTLSQIRSSAGVAEPLVLVVINNSALAAIKFESEIMGWPDRGSAIPDIDFAQYARSVGVRSRRVDSLRDFRFAFDEAISASGPYLIDARCVLNDAPVQAGKKNWRQILGFFVAWSKEGPESINSLREVVRAVVLGKLEEMGVSW